MKYNIRTINEHIKDNIKENINIIKNVINYWGGYDNIIDDKLISCYFCLENIILCPDRQSNIDTFGHIHIKNKVKNNSNDDNIYTCEGSVCQQCNVNLCYQCGQNCDNCGYLTCPKCITYQYYNQTIDGTIINKNIKSIDNQYIESKMKCICGLC